MMNMKVVLPLDV